MDNGEVKKFRPRPVKAPQGGEENVLKELKEFSPRTFDGSASKITIVCTFQS